jgi:dTDP-4-dehydrorhamnose reductase
MRILVTGAAGMFGGEMVKHLSDEHEVRGIDLPDADLTDFEATRSVIHAFEPDLVIHPAAWTDVNGCALEPEKAIRINGFGSQHVAIATAEINAAIVYISSNEVFDGYKNKPYREYDVTNPINPYGYSKVVGERAVMSLNPRHYVVRAAWMFGHGGKNFIQAILNAAQAGKQLRVVTNEVANPTYTNDLTEAIGRLILTGRYGVYHLTNAGACSRYAFARYILDRAGYESVSLTPITGSEWQRPSQPPEYTSLANEAGALIGIKLRHWMSAVDAFLKKEGLFYK